MTMNDPSSASRDPVSGQLAAYAAANPNHSVLTSSNGAPLDTLTASLTAGPQGPVLLQDFALLDHLSRFDRERIPERVVHAKGAGAFGYFVVTDPFIQTICKAKLFDTIGKQTPVAVRFSTVGGESGSADSARDPRGFAVKFYTEEGNWDLVGNNTPIFFLRDPILFPSFIHTQKRNPATHLASPEMFWDFISLRPETTHQVSFLFSDRGTPNGYRHMNGYGSHTFKNVNSSGEPCYFKYHLKTDQGISNLTPSQAKTLASEDPDYAIRDLYNAIERGGYPSWTLYVQVMTFAEAASVPFNPFDLTKIWPHSQFPLRKVGSLALNRNPKDYFAEVEQLAFAPSHMIPGIEPSPDKMLQARLFSYPDTHRHRLGANYQSLPVNKPLNTSHNYQRDGPMQMTSNGAGAPNYFPNSFNGPQPHTDGSISPFSVQGQVERVETGDEDNFSQCRTFYTTILDEAERDRLTTNIASHLVNVVSPFIRQRAIQNFAQVHPNYGRAIERKIVELQRSRRVQPAAVPPVVSSLSPPRHLMIPPSTNTAPHQRPPSCCLYGYSSKM